MQEIIQKVLSNNLADFEGLEISGSIPLRDGFLNEAIASFLSSMQDEGTTSGSGANSASNNPIPPNVDVKALLQMVRKVEVQSEQGAVTVRFEVRR